MIRRIKMSLWQRWYVFDVITGLCLTAGDLLKHLFLFLANLVGINTQQPPWITREYPEEKPIYPSRFRARHRLTLNPNGTLRCTACFLCATACPAQCIYIEPAEHDDPGIEKFPARYEIDTLLCIYCGYCVEACPVDAIRMDTGIQPEIYSADPRAFIEDKEVLMMRSRLLEDFGPDKLLDDHLKRLRQTR